MKSLKNSLIIKRKISRINPNGYFNFYYLFYNKFTGFVTILERTEKKAREYLKLFHPNDAFLFMSKARSVFDFNITNFTQL